ncbi:MAG: aspartoacylase [Pyrinomonadaceae bacterium]|nr:aspartoacylase [Pyrinomonadaceae bacterium]
MQPTSTTQQKEPINISIPEGDHVIGEVTGDADGPSLIVVGSVHGNEPSGALAMRRMLPELRKLSGDLRGRVFLIAGNTRAISENVRFIDDDLNRHWTAEKVLRNDPASEVSSDRVEDLEQRELLAIFDRVLSTARDEVYAMDLHSTSSQSSPFAMIGDTLRNRRFAQKFPATFLLGIEEQLDSTILEYINNRGAVTLGFEAGQHSDATAIDNQEALIWLALVNAGIVSGEKIDLEKHETTLRKAMNNERRIIEIRHRHAITPEDNFEMNPGYKNFQPVKKGEVLARDKDGQVKAKETSLILMPLYQEQGNDGFFLGREISPFWLWLSRILRQLGIGSLMGYLPGVNQDPQNKDSYIVNTRVARIFPLQIFHLLGFRKRRWKGDKLVVSRRKHDTRSPFRKKRSD